MRDYFIQVTDNRAKSGVNTRVFNTVTDLMCWCLSHRDRVLQNKYYTRDDGRLVSGKVIFK